MSSQINIIIADNRPVLRDGLKLILEQDKDLVVLACAKDGRETMDLVKKHLPHVVIIDIDLQGLDAIETVKLIKAANRRIKTIVLSETEDVDDVRSLIEAGSDGFLLKSVTDRIIKNAIRAVNNNLTVFDEKLLLKVRESANSLSTKFTRREMQIIKSVVAGKTNKVIASELNLAEGTVKNYMSVILNKAGVASRTQLVSLVITKMPELG